MTTEHTIQNAIRNALAGEAFLFRGNVGVGWQGTGKPIKVPYPMTVNMNPGDVLLRQARTFDTGLPKGFHDVFGWVEVTITPDMVGQKIARFTSFDTKSETGRKTPEQVAFANAVNNSGGRAGFARSVEEARAIIGGNNARTPVHAGTPPDRKAGRR